MTTTISGSTGVSKVQTGAIEHGDLPSGAVLQVVNFISTAKTSQTLTRTDAIVSDITKSITPLAANSKFLVNIRWFGEARTGWDAIFNIHMDGTRVNVNGGTAHYTGLAMPSSTYHAVDDDSTADTASFSTVVTTSAPAGTALVFKLMVTGSASLVMWTNRCFGNAGADGYENSTSEIIITEIAG